MLESSEKAILAARLADDKKAEDLVVLDVRDVCMFTDAFVICTSGSPAQSRAIVSRIREGLAEQTGVRPVMDGGSSSTGWVVLDYGDVVVHVMDTHSREFYQLESLWGDGRELAWAGAEAMAVRA